MASIITLLTDFGIKDGYVASMKGVILSITPEVRLVDISHFVPPQDVRAGAFLLASVYRDFPAGTVHLAVVDPGVGTRRRALAIKTPRYAFVGPDNGLFAWVLCKEPQWEAVSLENPHYWRDRVSNTFHGRDVFAPVAAHLAGGVSLEALGSPCMPWVPEWRSSLITAGGLQGEVVTFDRFGNAITNLNEADLRALGQLEETLVTVGHQTIGTPVHTYGDAEPGGALALIGSSGYLEIAVNRGSAAEALMIRTGDLVTVSLKQKTDGHD